MYDIIHKHDIYTQNFNEIIITVSTEIDLQTSLGDKWFELRPGSEEVATAGVEEAEEVSSVQRASPRNKVFCFKDCKGRME